MNSSNNMLAIYEKALLDNSINAILKNRGYRIMETIGHGSYAKVK